MGHPLTTRLTACQRWPPSLAAQKKARDKRGQMPTGGEVIGADGALIERRRQSGGWRSAEP